MADRTFSFPSRAFVANRSVPGDKSLAHRALILAAMADGTSTIGDLPSGRDVASTRHALIDLGITFSNDSAASPGIGAWREPTQPLDCGNSGTTMRLLTGALAGSRVTAALVGDASLMRRPMGRLVPPLRILGASVNVTDGDFAPIRVEGGALQGGDVVIPIPSAQVRTAVMLAALRAQGETRIDSPPGFRDHTERWLEHLGLGTIESSTRFVVHPAPIPPIEVRIPGDPSSASCLWAAAAVRPGSRIVTPAVSLNRGRSGFLEVIKNMGAGVEISDLHTVLGDDVGTVTVTGRDLHGVRLGGDLTVRTLDELPLLAVVAAAATGATKVSGAGELKAKESDRIASSVALARLAGASAAAFDDGFTVGPGGDTPTPSNIDVRGDHRVAMAGAIAAVVTGSAVTVEGFEAVDVSWPGFGETMEALWS